MDRKKNGLLLQTKKQMEQGAIVTGIGFAAYLVLSAVELALAADLANSILVDVTNDYSTNPMFTQDVLQFVLKRDNLNREEPETRMLTGAIYWSTNASFVIS